MLDLQIVCKQKRQGVSVGYHKNMRWDEHILLKIDLSIFSWEMGYLFDRKRISFLQKTVFNMT